MKKAMTGQLASSIKPVSPASCSRSHVIGSVSGIPSSTSSGLETRVPLAPQMLHGGKPGLGGIGTVTPATIGAAVTGAAVVGTGAAVTGAAVTGEAVTGAAVSGTGAAVTGAAVTGEAVAGTGAAVTGAAVTGAAVMGASVPGVDAMQPQSPRNP